MKKLMIAAAALAAGVAMADVESANVVGYNTVKVGAGETMILGVQFEDVVGGGLTIDKLFSWTDPQAQLTSGNGADRINIYNAKTGWKYYFWRKSTNAWVEKGQTKKPTSYPTLVPGDSCYFVRATGASVPETTLTLSGGVKALNTARTFEIDAGETAIICNPWPMSLSIEDIADWTDKQAQLTSGNGADRINIYNAKTGWKYYFWRKSTNAWVEKGQTKKPTSYAVLNPGEAFFFVRATGASVPTTQLTLKGPAAE